MSRNASPRRGSSARGCARRSRRARTTSRARARADGARQAAAAALEELDNLREQRRLGDPAARRGGARALRAIDSTAKAESARLEAEAVGLRAQLEALRDVELAAKEALSRADGELRARTSRASTARGGSTS